MTRLKIILLMLWVAGLSPVASAKTQQRPPPPARQDEGMSLVVENGTIGILKVRAIFEVQSLYGRVDLWIVTADTGFLDLAAAMKSANRSVVAEIEDAGLQLSLRSHPAGRLMFGHVVESSQRVYVMPESQFDPKK